MNYSLNFSGFDELTRKLSALSSVRLEAVIAKQAVQLLQRARSAGGTPVDTGELRQSSRADKNSMGYGAEYAAHVEYGHRTRGGGYVPGQYYLRANVEQQAPIFKEDLLKQIEKAGE